MLIFCCIWSSSLCTLVLHIAGSLWRLDFNHSSLFRPPSSPLLPFPSLPSLVHPIYMRKCLWSIYLSLLLPPSLQSFTRARAAAIRITFFLSDTFPPIYIPCPLYCRSWVFSDSHVLLASLSPSLPPLYVASLKGSFFLLVRKTSKFRGTEGSTKWPIRYPEGPKRDLRIAWN